MTTFKWNDQTNARLVELVSAGLDSSQVRAALQKEFGVSLSIDALYKQAVKLNCRFGKVVSPWNSDRVAVLKDLWKKGLTASQIAAEIGAVARCAVLGKAHRLGLPARKRSGPPKGSKKPKRGGAAETITTRNVNVARNKAMATNPSRIASVVAPPAIATGPVEAPDLEAPKRFPTDPLPLSRRCSIIDLKHEECRWPLDDDPSVIGGRYFCGAPAKGCVYCSEHAGRAFGLTTGPFVKPTRMPSESVETKTQ